MNTRLYIPALTFVALGLGGCFVEADTEPVAYAEVSTVPVEIETYPSVVYEGRTTYLVNDRWYYRDGGRWVYYRREPAELRRQRPYVQRAPRAYRRR